MFDFLKKKDKGIEIGAPVKGKAVPISQVSDPTFGEEILGKGVAIQPAGGKIYAPADGTIEMLFDTKHAVSLDDHRRRGIACAYRIRHCRIKGRTFYRP